MPTTIVQRMQENSTRVRHRDADVDTGNRNIESTEYKTASLYHKRVDIAEYPPPRRVQDPMQETLEKKKNFPMNYPTAKSQQ